MHYRLKTYFDYFSNISIKIKVFVIVLLAVLFIDMQISNAAHLFYKDISTDIGVAIFITISFVYLIVQQYILSYANKEPLQIQVESSSFRTIKRIINFITFFIVICFLTIILEILISQYYDSIMLLLVLGATNAIAIIAMGTIASKFFSWYRNRKQATILIFGTMALTISITAFVTVLFMGSWTYKSARKSKC